jgi:predicted nucleotidyltransferase
MKKANKNRCGKDMRIDKVLKDKRDEVLRIAASYGARNVRILGSLARGEAGPDSDIDILVNLDSGRSLLDIIALKQDLEDLLGCEVDVVTEEAISPYIREQVLKETISL